MRKIETPAPLRDVIRRRLKLAAPRLLELAFGHKKVAVVVYSDNRLSVISLGSNEFQRDIEDLNRRYRTPVPWLALKGAEKSTPMFQTKGGRHVYMSVSAAGNETIYVVGPGSTVYFEQCVFETPVGKFDVPSMCVAGNSETLTWSDIAEDFESFITGSMSPYVARANYGEQGSGTNDAD